MSSETATGSEPLKRAFAAFQAGDLTGAEGLCQNFGQCRVNPTALHFDALHLLAAVQFRAGRLADALASYDAALAIRPDFADVLTTGPLRSRPLSALTKRSRATTARSRCGRISSKRLVNRGNALVQMKRFEEALASYDQALAIRPDYATVLNNRGSALMRSVALMKRSGATTRRWRSSRISS